MIAFRFSALTRRIILFNAIALLVLVGGVIAVQSSRVGLVDERLTSIGEQGRIVASTLAEYASDVDLRKLKVSQAEPLLRQLLAPTRLRGRLYDTDGRLVIDTRNLLARNIVQSNELPPLDPLSRLENFATRIYDGMMGVRPFAKLQPYFEAGDDGRVYDEVNSALKGETQSAQRVDEQNKLVLSVAVPVQRFKAISGVLLVSTESGDIDDILREERATLIEVFLVAIAAMIISSLFLSRLIAAPVRHLAEAADRVRSGHAGRETIPNMEERGDEIGELSASLSAMTSALYARIDAIESFAADVAHELKNPLTSLRNAVGMLARLKDSDDVARAKMLTIVREDVKRIDRLITDISDASRLDAELSREANTPIDLSHLLKTLVEIYSVMDDPREINMALDLQLPEPTYVLGHDERLGQVFRNLIDNAISFSPPKGTVKISATARGRIAVVTVEDEGPGIPPDNLETIFDRFYTERPADQDFGNNSGLGLSIARQIVNSMGGRIRAENRATPLQPLNGARFTVELVIAEHA